MNKEFQMNDNQALSNNKATENENPFDNMALKKIFSIKDSEANLWHTPFFNRSGTQAKRMVGMTVNDKNSILSQYPEQFEVYLLGHFNDHTGKITLLKEPNRLCGCETLVKDQ